MRFMVRRLLSVDCFASGCITHMFLAVWMKIFMTQTLHDIDVYTCVLLATLDNPKKKCDVYMWLGKFLLLMVRAHLCFQAVTHTWSPDRRICHHLCEIPTSSYSPHCSSLKHFKRPQQCFQSTASLKHRRHNKTLCHIKSLYNPPKCCHACEKWKTWIFQFFKFKNGANRLTGLELICFFP